MPLRDAATHRRELGVTFVLSLLLGVGAFLYLYVITGGLFLAVLAAVVAMAALGAVHYAIWGRKVPARRRGEDPTFRR
jgi:hypothetical protein